MGARLTQGMLTDLDSIIVRSYILNSSAVWSFKHQTHIHILQTQSARVLHRTWVLRQTDNSLKLISPYLPSTYHLTQEEHLKLREVPE